MSYPGSLLEIQNLRLHLRKNELYLQFVLISQWCTHMQNLEKEWFRDIQTVFIIQTVLLINQAPDNLVGVKESNLQ